jgi:hypothetical protein
MQLPVATQDTTFSGSDDTPEGVGGETVCHRCGTRVPAGDPDAIAPDADAISPVATARPAVIPTRNLLCIASSPYE